MANVGHINVPIHRPIEMYASKELIEAIEALRRPHLDLDEDCYYSCPKAPHWSGEGSASCNDDAKARGDCTCGADIHNAKVDELLKQISYVAALPPDDWPKGGQIAWVEVNGKRFDVTPFVRKGSFEITGPLESPLGKEIARRFPESQT